MDSRITITTLPATWSAHETAARAPEPEFEALPGLDQLPTLPELPKLPSEPAEPEGPPTQLLETSDLVNTRWELLVVPREEGWLPSDVC